MYLVVTHPARRGARGLDLTALARLLLRRACAMRSSWTTADRRRWLPGYPATPACN
jgi:hypothetical protein